MSDLSSMPPPDMPTGDDGDWRDPLATGWDWFRRRSTRFQVVSWMLLAWLLPIVWLLQWRRDRVGVGLAAGFAVVVAVAALGGALGDDTPPDVTVQGPAEGAPSDTPEATPEATEAPAEPSPEPTPVATSEPTPSPEPTTPSESGAAASEAAASAEAPMEAAGLTTTVTRIVDGDTLYLADLDERLRLIGIDTPETKHPDKGVECFGREASARLGELVPPGTEVRVEWDVERIDRYDRPLGYLYRADDGLFVNLAMVKDGYASAYTAPPNVAHQDEFVQAQSEAREASRGLWSACDGEAADEPAGGGASQSPSPPGGGSAAVVPPPAGSGTESEAEAAAPGAVEIEWIEWDGPGRDVEYNDSEYVVLANSGGSTVDVGGWSVTDLKDHRITIPSGYSIAPGGQLRVYTGPGDDTTTAYFDGRGQAIWNNKGGDTATLRDNAGAVVDEYSYSS